MGPGGDSSAIRRVGDARDGGPMAAKYGPLGGAQTIEGRAEGADPQETRSRCLLRRAPSLEQGREPGLRSFPWGGAHAPAPRGRAVVVRRLRGIEPPAPVPQALEQCRRV